MQTVLKQRPEIAAVVEEAVSGVIADEERRERAVGYIHRFTEIPESELPLDLADFAIILKQITVRLDGTLTVELLDGAAVRLTAPVYGPQRGWMKPPRQIAEGEPVGSETEAKEHQNHDRNDAWDGKYCRRCGRPVTSTPGRRKKMYCGDDCRKKWWSKHRVDLKGKNVQTKTCICCGKEFRAFSSKHQKYYSQECYRKMRWGNDESACT